MQERNLLFEEKTVSTRLIYQGQILSLKVDTVVNSSGEEATREIVLHNECITVVPVDECGNILMVKQYRKAIEKVLLEIPAGGIETGENIEAAVVRECQEEIGYRPGKMVKLGGFYSSPGFCNEYLHLYVVTDLTHSRLIAEDTEGIEVVCVDPRQIRKLIRSGEICDSKSIAGLLFYLDYRERQPVRK
jgi:ADP-ribose pyrophosphatase